MDYRNTKYCKTLDGILEKKNKVKDIVLNDHPRVRDFHRYIRVNDMPYKTEFIKAYNGKCAYCGVSKDLIEKTSFEIDHFKKSSSPEFGSMATAGYIENLVLACRDCNNHKRDFSIKDNIADDLNPDGKGIVSNYIRDDMYYIRISNSGKQKKHVVEFYERLHLGSEVHRLDYLLMNMIGLLRENENSRYSGELAKAIVSLKSKRNNMSV